ncbi:hypothetical protein BDV38DRAFT_293520 [Aspergillus pseudotamarii]|uniref:FAD/NAD(P)-binding domain-containing protein n=1 Tax=Aspergillus pseudotamarii TaxID=132259 RepID=A0A5N6T9W1_ASPPS|nr:uncharacterized protein BDV38DRAFT_293520 [Aspergillus pseudotamarii]KAE8143076.1 hypothetical protein BDV38DRAFT_293520 [Aspergillus pseudotamarii]
MSHVVIIGASFAGIPIAHSLLTDVPSIKVTLLNPSTFYFTIAAPRILAKQDAFRPEQYLPPIEKAFVSYPKTSFEFIKGCASAIDVSTRTQSNSDNIETLIQAAQACIKTSQSIVIGVAGPIVVELAGELAEAARLAGRGVSITLVSASSRILPMLQLARSRAAEKLLAAQGVRVLTNQKVTGAMQSSDSGIWKVTLSKDGGELDADLYISTTGALPNNEFSPMGFLNENRWVVVDKELPVVWRGGAGAASLPIYVAGDITNKSMRLSFKAREQAAVVANNMKPDTLGQGRKRKTYDQGNTILMMVPVGSTGATGLIFGWTPWSTMVKMVQAKDFLISRAQSSVAAS